jgi:pilus assembly protein Flp/PilA
MLPPVYTHIHHLLDRLRRDQHGAALLEYGLLVGLIAVICSAAVVIVGTQISAAFSFIASSLTPGL